MDISPSTVTLNFLLERNELISLIMLAEKCNLKSLRNRSACQTVSKAFSMSENIAAIEILFLKYRVTCPQSSYTEVSHCNVHKRKTDLHVSSSVLQRAIGLFVEELP